jgi:hypothetical protein
MTTTLNPHFLSELEATPTAQITDTVDSIHSGIVKALHLAARGTYALKDTGADFDITQSSYSSVTRLAVKGGKAYRDGALVTLGSGSGSTNNIDCTNTYDPGTGQVDVTPVSGGDVYLFLVGNSSDALVLRGTNGTTGKVPELVEGDIPIAIVKVVASSDDDATDRPIQYLTTSKVANTVSVGYDSSGYTEAGNITGSASGLLYSSGLTTVGAVLTMATNEPSVVNNDVLGRINFQAPLDTGADSDLVGASIAAVAQDTFSDTVNSTALIFQTGKSETATTKMIIDEDGNVGIGENAPDAPLHVKYSSTSDADPALILESTATSGVNSPDIKLYRNSSSPADNDYLGNLIFTGNNLHASNGSVVDTDIEYARIESRIYDVTDGTEDGALIFSTKVAGSNSSTMYIKDGRVGIGSAAPDGELHISGAGHQLVTIEREANTNGYGTGIQFQLGDSASSTAGHDYAAIYGGIEDNTNGSEDGQLVFHTSLNGTLTEAIKLTSDGKLRVAGNVIQASDGGTTITMDTDDNVTAGGALTATTTVTATTGLITNGYTSLEPVEVNNSGAGPSGTDNLSLSKTIVCLNHTSSTAHNYRLPSASGVAQMFFIFKNISGGTITIIPNNSSTLGSGSDVLDGGSSIAHPLVTAPNVITLTTMQSITLMAYTDGQFGAASGTHGLNGTEGWISLPAA